MKRIPFKCRSVQSFAIIAVFFFSIAAVITGTAYAAAGEAKTANKAREAASTATATSEAGAAAAVGAAKEAPTEANTQVVSEAKSSDVSAIAQLKGLLGPISSIQGSFNQKVMNERGKLLRQSHGMMWLKKPGKFRWEVQGKDKHLIVSNGKEVWDFDPELSQVTIQSLPKSGSTPIYFLTGDINALSNDFNIAAIKADAGKCLNGSDTCFELKPKASSSTFHWIRIGFSENVLKEIEMLDQLGQRSLFSFQKISTNQTISQKQFHFVPPNGVDIIRN